MSNHNAARSFFDNNDDDDDADYDSIFPKRPPKKPVKVNNNLINFSLSEQKAQQARVEPEPARRQTVEQTAHQVHAVEQARVSQEAAIEDDDDDETETTPGSSRRKRAGRSLRRLLKRNRPGSSPVREAPPQPDETETSPPEKPDLTVLPGGLAAANRDSSADRQPDPEQETPEEATVPETLNEQTFEAVPETETEEEREPAVEPVAQESEPEYYEPAHTREEGEEAEPAASEASASEYSGDNPEEEPSEPIPDSTDDGGSGGGNRPPVPPEVVAGSTANFMPPSSEPVRQEKAPVTIIERPNITGPAWIAFIAATYFRRRGERRMKREQKRTNEQLKRTQSQVDSEAWRSRRTEEAVRDVQRRREQSPFDQGATTANRPRAAEVPQAIAGERYPAASQRDVAPTNGERAMPPPTERQPEKADNRPAKAAEVFAASPLGREIAQKEADREAKQAEQLRTAAQNTETSREVTKETVFERRHEVKDDAAPQIPAASDDNQVRISTVVQPANQSQATPPTSVSGSSVPADQQQPASAAAPSVYKQSLRVGFIIGLIVVTVAAIIFIIQR